MVLDTHVFLWYATGDERLPISLRSRMDSSGEPLIVPSIGIWECLLLNERGRINLGPNPHRALRTILRLNGFDVADLSDEVVYLSRSLLFEHNDPADRFIAATAHALGMSLATLDSRLLGLPWLQTEPI